MSITPELISTTADLELVQADVAELPRRSLDFRASAHGSNRESNSHAHTGVVLREVV